MLKKVCCVLSMLALCLSHGIAFGDTAADEELEKEISAFEITAKQRELAQSNEAGYPVLDDLAQKKGVVLMYGPGFNAPHGTVRISLANLNRGDYTEIARRLFELLDEYYEESQIAADKAA